MKPQKAPEDNRNIVWNLVWLIVGSVLIGTLIYFVIIAWAFPNFSDNWNLLEGFASVLSLSLLAGGLVFAAIEYISAERAKYAEKVAEDREKAKLSYEIYNAIYHKLTDPEQEAARRWILTNISIKKDDEDLGTWYEKTQTKIMSGAIGSTTGMPEGQHAVKLTLNCFDYIGFISIHYWDMEDDSLDWISAPIAKIWRRIGPYVSYVRELRKTTDYYLSAEHVGDLCIEWRQKKGLPDEEIAANTP